MSGAVGCVGQTLLSDTFDLDFGFDFSRTNLKFNSVGQECPTISATDKKLKRRF
jgi:hypothetical protein